MEKFKKLKLVFQTLGDVNRLKIIQMIGEEKRAVSEVTESLGLSQPLISHHLKALKKAQLLESTRQGPFVYYQVKDKRLLNALDLFGEIMHEIDIEMEESFRPMFCHSRWAHRKR